MFKPQQSRPYPGLVPAKLQRDPAPVTAVHFSQATIGFLIRSASSAESQIQMHAELGIHSADPGQGYMFLDGGLAI